MPEQDKRVSDILKSLQERAKELNCLYRVEELTNNEDAPLDEVIQKTIDVIPPGWQFPDVCAARISVDGV